MFLTHDIPLQIWPAKDSELFLESNVTGIELNKEYFQHHTKSENSLGENKVILSFLSISEVSGLTPGARQKWSKKKAFWDKRTEPNGYFQ